MPGKLHEALLWNQLKRGSLNGLDFDRQKVIGNYIVDYYCTEMAVVIEIDGLSHDGRQDYDEMRYGTLRDLGLTFILVLVDDVLNNLKGVVSVLSNHPCLTPPIAVIHPGPACGATPPEDGN